MVLEAFQACVHFEELIGLKIRIKTFYSRRISVCAKGRKTMIPVR
jgi:hypothetical protein